MGRHSAPEEFPPESQQPHQWQDPGFDPANYSWEPRAPHDQQPWYSGPDAPQSPAPQTHEGHPVIDHEETLPYGHRYNDEGARPRTAYGDGARPDDREYFGYDDKDDADAQAPRWRSRAEPMWLDDDSDLPPLPNRSRWYDDDETVPGDNDLADQVRRREAAQDPDEDDGPLAQGAEEGEADREKKPNRRFRRILYVAAPLAAVALFAGFTHSKGEDNTREHGMPTATSGPNMIPSQTVDIEPMDTVEERTAHVQRAVNNGEYKGQAAELDVVPGVLTYHDATGEDVKVVNPILVTDGLGSNLTNISSSNPDLNGHLFSIKPVTVNESGVSYQVTNIDPMSITGFKWGKGVKHDKGALPVIHARAGWNETNKGMAVDTDSDAPYHQTKSGQVIDPEDNTSAKPMPLAQEIS